jgi:hypothetical protein
MKHLKDSTAIPASTLLGAGPPAALPPTDAPPAAPRSTKGAMTVFVLRIDPKHRTVARIPLVGKNLVGPLRKSLRTVKIGWQELVTVDDKPVMVVAATSALKSEAGWRLRGGRATAGAAILFGRGPNSASMSDCPVDAAWVRRHIVWLTPEETAQDDVLEVVPEEPAA